MSGRKVIIIGEVYDADLSVGGGPIMPPAQPPGIWPSPGYPAHPIAPGGPPPVVSPPIYYPPGIWPSPGHPAHPIVLPPYEPGGPPVTIWPSPGRPSHPIVMPEPPPPPEEGGKPPPDDGGWGYHPEYGWGYFPAPGEPGPKA